MTSKSISFSEIFVSANWNWKVICGTGNYIYW